MKKHDIIDLNMCAGCGLCESLFSGAKMEYNNEGYLRPNFPETINHEDLQKLKDVCPGYLLDYSNVEQSTKKSHPLWGNYNSVSIGYSLNKRVRNKASSGGIISTLLIYLLDKNIIDEVIHIGVSENGIDNKIYTSSNSEQVLEHSGSRYSPSAPLINITDYLKQDKRFAFVGKPCDVAALMMLSKKDKRVNEKIIYKFSFFCAGVPSIKGTYEIFNKFKINKDDVKEFRYRGDGWPGYTRILTKENKEYKMSYNESWGSILNKHLQPRCKLCFDGIGEFADIVCGDGWIESKNGYPDFSEADGRSLIITRNKQGDRLLDSLLKDGYLSLENDFDINVLEKIQPYQAKRRKQLVSRIFALKSTFRHAPSYPTKKLIEASKTEKRYVLVRGYLGTLYRIAKGRI
ncbi:Coenzyme F420 hydrogenase/dehydrogenase, beta subunit C-terminal domain [Caldibacillus thermoamylovorans]